VKLLRTGDETRDLKEGDKRRETKNNNRKKNNKYSKCTIGLRVRTLLEIKKCPSLI